MTSSMTTSEYTVFFGLIKISELKANHFEFRDSTEDNMNKMECLL